MGNIPPQSTDRAENKYLLDLRWGLWFGTAVDELEKCFCKQFGKLQRTLVCEKDKFGYQIH